LARGFDFNSADSLTWALLQERLTTTPYGSATSPELFKFPVFLNTVQSLFAALTGYLYLQYDTKAGTTAPIFPNRKIVVPLFLVAVTSSLASPFGYASLAHIDYITFILAKSCKLLPVMFLHITLFQKRYPLYKYLVVLAVTSGVAVFTLHAGSSKAHSKPSKAAINPDRNGAWGLLLLGINLLFDGLTNTTQDYIFQTFQPYKGPQMMCANNIMSTLLTFSYLALSPYLVHTGIGEYLGMDLTSGGGGEFAAALGFMKRHPGVWYDVLGFAICGAVGQVFICKLLSFFCPIYQIININSLHALNFLLFAPRNHNCYPENANYDPFCRLVWPPSRRQAMDGRGACLRWYRSGRNYYSTGES
jgi:UDP-galactose transporter B1